VKLKANEVFTPGTFPVHTYVTRSTTDIEQTLRDSIDTPGQIVSISGPSKSGKTVLVERVVTKDLILAITGASISKPSDVWDRVLDSMDTPTSIVSSKENSLSVGGEVEAKGGASIPFLAKGEVGLTGKIDGSSSTTTTVQRGRRGLEQVVAEIANSDFVVLLDDFHYMPRDIQSEVANNLKEAVRRGIKIITASVSHRGDDVVRANPELRGRVRSVDLSYWDSLELKEIARVGFEKLNAHIEDDVINVFCQECAGSPQLMQSICLHTCFHYGIREAHQGDEPLVLNPKKKEIAQILKKTSTTTDFRSLVDVLDAGPVTRGIDRKTYKFSDGGEGDVYSALLKAVASDPPQLSFSYDELKNRTEQICSGDAPTGSSIISSCAQMARLSVEKFPKERTIDWDSQKFVFDLPEPYLMFYLRWSDRVKKN